VTEDLTELLARWSDGDKEAERELFALVHHELRRIAHRYVSRSGRHQTLQTTAVVHEAYLKLVVPDGRRPQDRAHFFAVCARTMRHILIDAARARGSLKRGENVRPVTLDEGALSSTPVGDEILALDEALGGLAVDGPRQAHVVELRYFGGLTNEEIAEVLKISPATVERDWRFARAWLYDKLRS
jgi:RNA polymerase sigma factor (TIGR02999 family)